MEAGLIALIVIVAIICTLAVVHIVRTRVKQRGAQGVLNVDYGDPENGPYLFLALDVPIAEVVSRKQAVFNINVIRHNSQK